MNNKINFFLIIFSLTLFSSCETMDLNGLKNQNEIGTDLIDPVYAFNFIQINLPAFVDDVNDITLELTRQYAMTGGKTYDNAYQPVNFNTNWRRAYTMLATIKNMEKIALERKQYDLLGASKIIRAYILFTMVDLYGDIPYSEALLGNGNLNPKFDKGSEIYKVAFGELDSAFALFSGPASTVGEGLVPFDLYYGTGVDKKINPVRWKVLARTLKFRALVTARKNGMAIGFNINSEITTLLTSDLIDTPAEDFAFKYSTDDTTFPTSSRHPLFNRSYLSGFSAPYISNYMLWTMVREKSTSLTNNNADTNLVDPRVPYYFCTQNASTGGLDTFTLPGKNAPRPDHYNNIQFASLYNNTRLTPFVYPKLGAGSTPPASPYFGADHGQQAGRPQDGDKVTIIGVYPGGGKFGGTVSAQTVNATAGQKGAGIMPIMLSSFVNFLKAEAYLTVLNNSSLAKVELIAGVNASISKAAGLFPTLAQPTTASINNYVNYVGGFYDANASKRLEIVMKEYFIASWGNGIETYNNYRRTGFPSNFQPTLELNSGNFFNCFYYPSDSEANNTNKPDNSRTRRVFWDVDSPILH